MFSPQNNYARTQTLQSDKNPAFVIINKEDYFQKMNDIPNDTTKFPKITHNPTDSITKKLNNLTYSIHVKGRSPKFPKLTGEYTSGYAFGNIKRHKPGNFIRPIISQIPTATYPIEKKLNELLTPYILNTYTLSSASDFLDILRDFPPVDDAIIASLDVESPFMNVPINKAIDFIPRRSY
ncbi:uncharacterized protein LOC143037337 [Oratosquilla oratoria]|uniref:uncharacterized protein LOC143037337 n=1 Tax=Oratosquilla oratoria TaxID=337810 RepID=UPI003F763A16